MEPKAGKIDRRIQVDLKHLQSLQRHARRISFLPRQPARSVLNGRHGSKIRGRGLNFEELRNYQQGDDIRTIDWKVTARTGEPHVRVYTEERDRPVLLLVDQRMSMFYGSVLNMKSVTAAEAAALAAWRVRMQGDRVGGIVFTDRDIAELKPQASGLALNRFLSILSDANGSLNAASTTAAALPFNRVLNAAVRIAKTGFMVLIFSDFSGLDERTEVLVRQLSAHNDVLLFPVYDPTGFDLPEDYRVVATDGHLQATIDKASGLNSEHLRSVSEARLSALRRWERKFGVPVLPLTTAEETALQFFKLLGVSQ